MKLRDSSVEQSVKEHLVDLDQKEVTRASLRNQIIALSYAKYRQVFRQPQALVCGIMIPVSHNQ